MEICASICRSQQKWRDNAPLQRDVCSYNMQNAEYPYDGGDGGKDVFA